MFCLGAVCWKKLWDVCCWEFEGEDEDEFDYSPPVAGRKLNDYVVSKESSWRETLNVL